MTGRSAKNRAALVYTVQFVPHEIYVLTRFLVKNLKLGQSMEYKLSVVFSVFVASMASETDFRWWSSSNIDMEAALPFVYPKKYFPPQT